MANKRWYGVDFSPCCHLLNKDWSLLQKRSCFRLTGGARSRWESANAMAEITWQITFHALHWGFRKAVFLIVNFMSLNLHQFPTHSQTNNRDVLQVRGYGTIRGVNLEGIASGNETVPYGTEQGRYKTTQHNIMVHMHGMYLGTTILFRCLKRGRADAITTNFLGMVVDWSWNGRGMVVEE